MPKLMVFIEMSVLELVNTFIKENGIWYYVNK